MRWLRSIFHRFRSLFRRNAVERELDQEIRFHVERQIAEHIVAGMSQEEARRAAQLEFGGVELFKEECRDARGVNRLESLLADLRSTCASRNRNCVRSSRRSKSACALLRIRSLGYAPFRESIG